MTTLEQAKREAAMRREKAQGGRASDNLTLRDYFAAKALQGFIANVGFRYATESETAEQVYKLADAMLKAREA